MMFNINGFLLITLIPLGWEVYFLYGFVAYVVALFMGVWADLESSQISNNSDSY
jgi:hypothetical protein